ncbi:hypothetical protein J2W28_005285 [Variovorax boronicumulans]|uniref:hypothetical protein n=1 Tax=Variovorax TaxID=34072 RepID=UPI0027862760|nr:MULTISPECIES: hypothetical protein [Variovorax]MDP9994913.1 hypothetical protein [Variovorax boronicumulans]MDQ0006115.1 hypothetical protein [Variovorax boronicumulans]MDQ0611166.1 hypothetical protein [Variovorax sp. W1I1]
MKQPSQPRIGLAAAVLFALCAVPGLAQAVTESEPLDMVYQQAPEPEQRPNGPPVETLRAPQGCKLYLPAIEDARNNQVYAGNLTLMMPTLHATPRAVESLRSGDAGMWTRNALLSTQRYGFQPTIGAPAAAAGAGQVSAVVALRLAHAWSAGLNLVSHVVLKVSYRLPGGEVATRLYHGMGTRTNWASGNGEFMSVLNLGMEEAVRSMATDAAALCEGKPLPAPAPAVAQ